MFRTRIKTLLFFFAAAALVLVARLFHLQILHNETYAAQARRVLLRPAPHLPFIRGSVQTADGITLASDQPSWDICLHYGMLAGDKRYLAALVDDGLTRTERADPSRVDARREEIFRKFNETWMHLAELSGLSRQELFDRCEKICTAVQQEHRAVSEHHGFDLNVLAETMAHPIVRGFNDQEQIDARRIFADMPWVEVQPSTRRVYTGERTFAHFLGRMGPVTRDTFDQSPFQDDPDRKYLAGETVGITGLERAFEISLRGTRGRVRTDPDGKVLSRTPATDGTNLILTLDCRLQLRLYDLLARHVEERGLPGGAVVVLHVPTREVTALVSYPSFDPNRLCDQSYYQRLREDTRSLPLLFRAANAIYPPGSIVKPLAVLAGLSEGVVTLETTVDCQGYRFPDQPTRWREWKDHNTGLPMRHGPVNAENALQHSCNVYCYHLAEKVGIEKLCNWFSKFGLGSSAGIGIAEDAAGILPSAEFLARRKQKPSAANARNVAIGQGNLSITPLQAANMLAGVASGFHAPVTLVRNDARDRPATPITDVHPSYFRAVRRGLYKVVNEFGGTAYRTARLDHPDFVLLGKTGSAECAPRPLAYDVQYQINDQPPIWETLRITYAGGAKSFLALRYRPGTDIEILQIKKREEWPPPNDPDHANPSHAWFAGYLLPKNAPVDKTPEHVFIVLLEFGGSGGRAAAPLGKKIAELLIDHKPPSEALTHAAAQEGGPR